jgi:hypothetical protein
LFPKSGGSDSLYPESKSLFLAKLLKNPEYYFTRLAEFREVIGYLAQNPLEETDILEYASLIRHITEQRHGVYKNIYNQNFRDLYLASARMRRVTGFLLGRRETAIRTLLSLGPLCFMREELEGFLLSRLDDLSDRNYSYLLSDLENYHRQVTGSFSKEAVKTFLQRGFRQHRFSAEYAKASRLYKRFFGSLASRVFIRPFIKCWDLFMK